MPEVALGLEVARPTGKCKTNRELALWGSHHMRPEDWDAMWEAQQGLCYLCRDRLPASRRFVHIDHDHSCCAPGKSCESCRRGLACQACNTLIGLARDDPARLRRIADSLEFTVAITSLAIAAKPVPEMLLDEAAT